MITALKFILNTGEMEQAKDILENYDPKEIEAHPQPHFEKDSKQSWEYITSSGKGKYRIFYVEVPGIGYYLYITFDGYRNSFKNGNQLFRIKWAGPFKEEGVVYCEGFTEKNVKGKVLAYKSSTPDVYFSPEEDTHEDA